MSVFVLASLLSMLACGDDDEGADSGPSDSGIDAARTDTGPEVDAGPDIDAGPEVDVGPGDDGGRPDTALDTAPDTGPPPSGRIIVDPTTPAWLMVEGSGPFYLCGPGDPEGFLYRGARNADGTRDGDQSDLIAKLAGTGANGIYFQAVRSNGGDGDADHNPFIDSDPTMGLDDAILNQWEGWFSEMEAAGIVIYFFFYDDSARIWNTGDSVGAEEEAFITGLVDRFEHHDRLIWIVAEEYQERLSAARVSNIAATIRGADDRNHVIGVHKLSGLDFDEFADDPNIDQFAIQHNVSTADGLHDGMVTAWGNAAGRYNLNMSETANHGVGQTARLKNWASALGGAYVMVLGQDIATTAVTDLEDCGRLVRFMEGTTFNAMEPHDELALGGTDYVLANPGDAYIAYAANAAGDVGLRGLDVGMYELTWFDPVDGDEVREIVDVSVTDAMFTPPAALGAEVALYARRMP